MKIATWNVNGIRARCGQLQPWLARERPDVVCLQEIKASSDQLSFVLCDLDGYWCHWHGERGYSGVGVHVRKATCPTEPVVIHPSFDFETRIAVADLGGLDVASVYVPNGGKDLAAKMRFLDALVDYAADARSRGRSLILCGDLNVTRCDLDVHPKERKPRAIGQLPEEREVLERLLECGLVDVGRALDPQNEGLFTWWAPWRNHKQRNRGWRLDYILASERVASRAVACSVLADVGTSDHAPVVATFDPVCPLRPDGEGPSGESVPPGSSSEGSGR